MASTIFVRPLVIGDFWILSKMWLLREAGALPHPLQLLKSVVFGKPFEQNRGTLGLKPVGFYASDVRVQGFLARE